jgi:hypothetical protein
MVNVAATSTVWRLIVKMIMNWSGNQTMMGWRIH